MLELPSSQIAVHILKESGCNNKVVKHCKAVSKFAVKIADKLKKKGVSVDVELVKIGGLLHDIGRSKTHGIDHAIVGSEIASSFKLPEPVIRIIERHIGSGIPAEEAVQLGLPNRDFMPITLEEKIVAYADKLITGDYETDINDIIEKFSTDLGSDHPAIHRLKKLHNEFLTLFGDI